MTLLALLLHPVRDAETRAERRCRRRADVREALLLALVTPVAVAALVGLVIGTVALSGAAADLYRQLLLAAEVMLAVGGA